MRRARIKDTSTLRQNYGYLYPCPHFTAPMSFLMDNKGLSNRSSLV
jgi:hypothetical protein